jgi:hypothetical protein
MSLTTLDANRVGAAGHRLPAAWIVIDDTYPQVSAA